MESLDKFLKRAAHLLDDEGGDKGYRTNGRELSDFVAHFDLTHGLGEIVYKAVRFRRRGNPDDLAKIAVWAFLEWRRAKKK